MSKRKEGRRAPAQIPSHMVFETPPPGSELIKRLARDHTPGKPQTPSGRDLLREAVRDAAMGITHPPGTALGPEALMAGTGLAHLDSATAIARVLEGLQPFGDLPRLAKTEPTPQVSIEFKREDLARLKSLVDAADTRQNGVAWAVTRNGVAEFFKPGMADDTDAMGTQFFEDRELIERLRPGGVDGVFMVIKKSPLRGNVKHLWETAQKIREAGMEVPMYILSITPENPELATARAFRFNPRASGEEIERALSLSQDVYDDFRRRRNRFGNEYLKPKYPTMDAREILACIDEETRFGTTYVARKFENQETTQGFEQSMHDSLNPAKAREDAMATARQNQKVSLQLGSDALAIVSLMTKMEQALLKKVFGWTRLVEELEIPTLTTIVLFEDGVAKRTNAIIPLDESRVDDLRASGILSPMLVCDSQLKVDVMGAICTAAGYLGKDIGMLAPLARACVDAEVTPNRGMQAMIAVMEEQMKKCAECRPESDPMHDYLVCLTVSRGKAREALWDRMEAEGQATPGSYYPVKHVREALETMTRGVNYPQGLRDFQSETVGMIERGTEHTLEELLRPENRRLIEIHGLPIVEMLHFQLEQLKEKVQEDTAGMRSMIEIEDDGKLKNKWVERFKPNRKQIGAFRAKQYRETLSAQIPLYAQAEAGCRQALASMIDPEKSVHEQPHVSEYNLIILAEEGQKIKDDEERERREEERARMEAIRREEQERTKARRRDLDERSKAWLRTRDDEKTIGKRVRELIGSTEFTTDLLQPVFMVRTQKIEHRELAREGNKLFRDIYTTAQNPGLRESAKAFAALRAGEWGEREITPQNLTQLARETVLAEYTCGPESQETAAYTKTTERVPEPLREDYGKTLTTYRQVAGNYERAMAAHRQRIVDKMRDILG
ncbi:MAG: hypothetical protein V1703_01735 [Candidatus Altiarchaeota archaeon]